MSLPDRVSVKQVKIVNRKSTRILFLISVLILVGMIGSAALTSLSFSRDIAAGRILSDFDDNAAVTFTPLSGYEDHVKSLGNGEIFFDLTEALADGAAGGFNAASFFAVGSEGNEVFSLSNHSDLAVTLSLLESTGGLALEGNDEPLNPGETGYYYFTIDTDGMPPGTAITGILRVTSDDEASGEAGGGSSGGTVLPPPSPAIFYDFTLEKTDLEDFIALRYWDEAPEGFVSNDALLFIENPYDTYTLTTTARLSDRANTSQSYGGYGLFFETTLDENDRDTGYILQFDRQLAGLVVRPRSNGYESNTILRIMNTDSPNDTTLFHSDLIPTSLRDPWWSQEHEMSLTVTDPDPATPEKLLSVAVDGEVILENYAFTGLEPGTPQYTGFRTWAVSATYESLSITSGQ